MMKVKLYGKLKESITKLPEIEDGMMVSDFITMIKKDNPAVKNIPIVVAINNSIITNTATVIHINDELALMPPFSGG